MGGHEVGTSRRPHDSVEGHTRSADSGADRSVSGTICDVVFTLVASYPGFNEGVEGNSNEEHDHYDGGHDHVPRPGVAKPVGFPARWHQPESTVGEADVPVRLGTRRDGGGVVGTVVPDRVDRERGGDQHDHTEDDEEESTCLRGEHGHHRRPHDVVVGAAWASELGVLVDDEQHHM